MTDAQHSEEKEALEDAIGRAAVYRGVALCLPEITRVGSWLTRDDGTVTGPNYTVTCAPSAVVKALIDADLDKPVEPPVVIDPPATDPPPVDPPVITPPVPPVIEPGSTPTVNVQARMPDGTQVNITLKPGERKPLVEGTLLGSAVFYADGRCVRLENAYAGLAGDLPLSVTVYGPDAAVLYSGDVVIEAYACLRPLWVKGQYDLIDSPDLSLFPKYGADSGKTSRYNTYMSADNSATGIGIARRALGDTGESDDFGPVPRWDTDWLLDQTNAEKAVVVCGMSDALSPRGFHCIDPATNKMLLVSDHPDASFYESYRGWHSNPIKPFTTRLTYSLDQAQAHAAAYCALAAAIRGSDYDREELAMWCNYNNSLWQGSPFRLPSGVIGPNYGQCRGKGRGLAILAYATRFTDYAAMFGAWAKDWAQAGAKKYLAQPGLQIDRGAAVYPGTGIGMWQQLLLVYGIGLNIEFGYTDWQPVLDAFAVPIFDALLNGTHEFFSGYDYPALKDAAGNVAPDFATALRNGAALSTRVAAALSAPESSQARINALYPSGIYKAGDFAGNAVSPDGYPAMQQPGLAMAVRHATDQMRAQAAWEKFKQYARCDYSTNPKYNVEP